MSAALIEPRSSILIGNSPSSQSFFNRLITAPVAPRETLYSSFIDTLAAASILLDSCFLFAAIDLMTACTDLYANRVAVFPQNLSAGIFVANQGITPMGGSAFIDTLVNPSLLTNFQQNSACCFFRLRGTNSPTNIFGNSSGTLSVTLSATGGHINWKINDHADGGISGNDAGAGSITDGFYILNRTSSTATALYKDGTQVAAVTQASAAIPNGTVTSSYNNGFTLSSLGFGASLSSGQITSLTNAEYAFCHAAGAV